MSILEHYGASFRPNQNAKSRLHLGEYVKALRYHEQADLTAIARWLSTTQRERIISGVPSWLAFAERWIRSKQSGCVGFLGNSLMARLRFRSRTELNEKGVPSPGAVWKHKRRRCKGWARSAIYGDQKRGFGILLNPLYRGLIVWNRTRRRVSADVPWNRLLGS